MLIGDPKQAIYGFRGADVTAYLKAASRQPTHVATLERNWRSEPGHCCEAFDALFGQTAPSEIRASAYRVVARSQ